MDKEMEILLKTFTRAVNEDPTLKKNQSVIDIQFYTVGFRDRKAGLKKGLRHLIQMPTEKADKFNTLLHTLLEGKPN